MARTSCSKTRPASGTSARDTSFPKKQLFILALVRLCEPIAFMSIFPYVYRMVENFGVTTNTTSIAMYAGMITSAFAFAEFSAGVWWGKLSDKVGRKPVLIGGLVGTALSMILFGFAPSLPVAILARALGGLLNGNIGVIQTTVAEIITHKKQQARAFSIMPFVWCMGSIIGPAIGGALSQPAINFPNYFAKGGLFDQFPFLLPNLICTMVLVCGIVVGILFLEETHAEKKHQRDYGREAGSWLIKRLRKEPRPAFIPITTLSDKALESMLDVRSASEDLPEAPPGYSMVNLSENTESRIPEKKAKVPVTKAFTKQIIMIIFGYGLLAYHTISFDQLMPIFMSEEKSLTAPELPFKFVGGFGLSASTIGYMLSAQGVYSMFAQLIIFPYLVNRFGALPTFRCILTIWPVLYFIVPYLVFLPSWLQTPGIFVCLLWRSTAQVLSYPAVNLLLTNSAQSTLVLGMINGVAASIASLSRALGPTTTGFLHSWGLNMGYSGLAWWINGLICLAAAAQCYLIQEPPTDSKDEEKEEDEDVEGAVHEPLLSTVDAETMAAKDEEKDEDVLEAYL